MKTEPYHLRTASHKARTFLTAASSRVPSPGDAKEAQDQLRELVHTVELFLESFHATLKPAPSYNDAASTAPAKPVHPWPAPTRNPAPTQAIGLMRSYLELPGSEVLAADKWAKRVAGYLFENLGSLP
jgi:hypothetical protein